MVPPAPRTKCGQTMEPLWNRWCFFWWEGEFVAVERMLSAPQIYMRVLRYVTIISIYTTATKQVPMLELFEWCSICGDWDALDPGREDFTVFFGGS